MKLKKYQVLPLVLVVYSVIVALFAYKSYGVWTQRTTVTLLIEFVLAVILYIVLKKRNR